MNASLVNTDYDWYRFLSERPGIDEVNFWRPHGGGGRMRAITPGEPLIFKLKKAYGDAIVGFGQFVMHRQIPVAEAWEVFGQGNGVASEEEFWQRIRRYVRRSGQQVRPTHMIGCILLTNPIFFPKSLWVDGARDWAPQIVSGKTYDLSTGEGARIWADCLRSAALVGVATGELDFVAADSGVVTDRFGKGRMVHPRLGQGTFRYAVLDAYGKCAVSKEHSLPALEAAHIKPYSHGGTHEVNNGLLLRADIHKLFDLGYVTVTPDHRFKVSERLAEEYHNGKVYYQLQDAPIWVPQEPARRPDRQALEYHGSEVFVG